jgi:tetratricopeptide (TPR) repeat protein
VLLEPLIETEQATDETVLVLAHAYFANGRVDSSIEVLRDAATRTPEPSVELLANLTSLLLDHRHGYEESAGILERGLRIHGPHFRLVNNLAYSYLMLDRVDEASSVIRRLPHPDERIESVELTATWGLLAFKLGDQGEGGRLYTLAQTEATRRGKVELAMQVRQKFALEMARFLLRRGDADSSRTFIEEGLRLKGREAFRSDLAELEREVEGLLPDRPKE